MGKIITVTPPNGYNYTKYIQSTTPPYEVMKDNVEVIWRSTTSPNSGRYYGIRHSDADWYVMCRNIFYAFAFHEFDPNYESMSVYYTDPKTWNYPMKGSISKGTTHITKTPFWYMQMTNNGGTSPQRIELSGDLPKNIVGNIAVEVLFSIATMIADGGIITGDDVIQSIPVQWQKFGKTYETSFDIKVK